LVKTDCRGVGFWGYKRTKDVSAHLSCECVASSKNNYFEFRGRKFRQVRGTAMGCNVAPTFANLFVAAYEYKQYLIGKLPKSYLRYIDDVLFLWHRTVRELDAFGQEMNRWSPSLKFIIQHDTKAHYLDLDIFLGYQFNQTGKLEFKNFRKPHNPLLYTNPNTYNANHIKFNWIQGEVVRLIRNSSNRQHFENSLKDFRKALRNRGYTAPIIDAQFSIVHYNDRSRLMNDNVEEVIDDIPKRIFIRNIPGRHLIVKLLRELETVHLTLPDESETLRAQIVITRGRTIMDYINASVKTVIGGHL
jgi:hypothetical protein